MHLIEKEIFGRSFIDIVSSIKTFYTTEPNIAQTCSKLEELIRIKLSNDRKIADEAELEKLLHHNFKPMEN